MNASRARLRCTTSPPGKEWFQPGRRRSRTVGEQIRYAPYQRAQDPTALQWSLWLDDHERRRRIQSMGQLRDHTLEVGSDSGSVGTFCYLHEVDSERLWSNTYQPIGGEVEGYSVNFALDRAVFRRSDHSIKPKRRSFVSPEDDVEIRRVTLINRSLRTRRLNLTSYVELSMAPHNADRQHPAFNKLFIQTEAVPQQQALLAYRRPRGAEESPIYVAHRLTLEHAEDEAVALRDRPAPIHRPGTNARESDGRLPGAWEQSGLCPGPDPQPSPEPDSGPGPASPGFPGSRRRRNARAGLEADG